MTPNGRRRAREMPAADTDLHFLRVRSARLTYSGSTCTITIHQQYVQFGTVLRDNPIKHRASPLIYHEAIKHKRAKRSTRSTLRVTKTTRPLARPECTVNQPCWTLGPAPAYCAVVPYFRSGSRTGIHHPRSGTQELPEHQCISPASWTRTS